MSNSKKEDMNSIKSSWWEVYIIRYSLGTLIGSLISWFLIFQLHEKSIIRIFISSKESVINYIVVAFMGLTFCYIASAPMLIAHTSRYQKRKEITKRITTIKPLLASLGWLLFTLSTLWILNYFTYPYNKEQFTIIISLLLITIPLIWIQVSLLPTSEDDIQEIFAFYDKLSLLRHYTFTDIMTSYRHLREHGNAYSVLILELILGASLLLSIKVHVYLVPVVIMAWTLPAAYAWQVGSNIEKRYIEKYYSIAERKHKYTIEREKYKSINQ